LAAELKREFDVEARLIKGGGGVFDVLVDGDQVFSKHRVGRFPDPGEVEGIVRRIRGS
jgi:selT/selW/selH-like putative selenoprotein